MAFNVKNEEADRLLRELTALTGEGLTEAIVIALSERLARERRIAECGRGRTLEEAIDQLRSLTVVDARSEDEILGLDERGLPA